MPDEWAQITMDHWLAGFPEAWIAQVVLKDQYQFKDSTITAARFLIRRLNGELARSMKGRQQWEP